MPVVFRRSVLSPLLCLERSRLPVRVASAKGLVGRTPGSAGLCHGRSRLTHREHRRDIQVAGGLNEALLAQGEKGSRYRGDFLLFAGNSHCAGSQEGCQWWHFFDRSKILVEYLSDCADEFSAGAIGPKDCKPASLGQPEVKSLGSCSKA